MKIQSVNPANETVNAEIETFSPQMAVAQCKAARAAFDQWKDSDFSERAGLLRKLAATLRQNQAEFARLMTLEMGKPITQSRTEVEKCAWTAEVYAESAKVWLAEESVQADGKRHAVRYEPLGVVLSVMPWNFPFWQALRFAIPTLAAGNTSVLRHSSAVPLCAKAIASAFEQAGFPQNVFNVVVTEHDAVRKMIASRHVAAVSLTGSEGAGRTIGALSGKHLKKCVLELGGSDPFLVLEDANVEKAAKIAVLSRTVNSGQSCIAAKRFIVDEKIAGEFTRLFVQHMKELVVGDPLDPKTQVGPLANKNQRDLLERQVALSESQGAKILCGGKRLGSKGFFFEPTVLTDIRKTMPAWKEEVFGPAAPILPVKNEKQALRAANDSDLGLAASVWTVDETRGEKLAEKLECGAVFLNGMVKSDPRMPFGGVKDSGIGRELGKWGLREFCNVKAVSVYG